MNFSQTDMFQRDLCCAHERYPEFDTRKHDIHTQSCIFNFNFHSYVCELVNLGWMETLANSSSLIS